MRRRNFAAGVLWLLVAGAQELPHGRQAILDRVVEAYKSVRSYQVEAVVSNRVLGEPRGKKPVAVSARAPEREVIDIAYAAPNRLRLAGSGHSEVTVFHDRGVSKYSQGANVYVTGPAGAKRPSAASNSDAHRIEALAKIGYADYSNVETGMHSANVIRQDSLEVDGVPVACSVIEGSYVFGIRRTFWVDTARNVVLREVKVVPGEGAGKGTELEHTVTVQKLSWNQPLADSLFEFRPPSGVMRDDGTVQTGPHGEAPPVVLTRGPKPSYTAEAHLAHLAGSVVLGFTLDEEGRPSRIQVTNSLGLGLDELATESLSQWRYSPAQRDGKPITVRSMMSFPFDDPPDSDWHLGRAGFQPEDGATRPVFLKVRYPGRTGDRQSGTVPLHLMIDRQGVPRDIQVMGKVDPKLAREAVAIVSGWRFTPGQRDGQAVAVAASFDLVHGRDAPLHISVAGKK